MNTASRLVRVLSHARPSSRAVWLLAAALSALSVLPAAPVRAGAKSTANVSISTVNRKATGSVANARSYTAAFDRDHFIGCWAETSLVNGNTTVGCHARRGSTEVSCSVTGGPLDPLILNYVWALGNIGSNAYIEFTWNSSNVCQTIRVRTDSRYAPKAL
ncbi:MAG TPA: hypothetical protein VK509_24725 [Polyangiales bacterium]|nr:hypothetical protein [Polyangiales bacterium]